MWHVNGEPRLNINIALRNDLQKSSNPFVRYLSLRHCRRLVKFLPFFPAWSRIHFPRHWRGIYLEYNGPNHFHVLYSSTKISSSRDRLILIPRQTLPKTTPMPVYPGIHMSTYPNSRVYNKSRCDAIPTLWWLCLFCRRGMFSCSKVAPVRPYCQGRQLNTTIDSRRLNFHPCYQQEILQSPYLASLDVSGHGSDIMWVSRNPMHPFWAIVELEHSSNVSQLLIYFLTTWRWVQCDPGHIILEVARQWAPLGIGWWNVANSCIISS